MPRSPSRSRPIPRPETTAPVPVSPESASTLIRAGLRYVTYTQPGISRVRAGRGFRYIDPKGRIIRAPDTLARIEALAIPPAWEDVWISMLEDGHLQAVGRDARGRRQYRYHAHWRAVRDAAKFDELLAVADSLPRLRRRVEQHLSLPGLPREKVLATIVWLLERTLIRVGNEESVRDQSFGLTTLEDRHAQIKGAEVRFRFRGKSGKSHEVALRDQRIARIVKQCQDIPGQELFQYLDLEGEPRDVASEHVNDYLQEAASPTFTAKVFRTWMATVCALDFFLEAGPPTSVTRGRNTVAECLRVVSQLLGNTPAVCRKSYVHPEVIQRYLSRELEDLSRGSLNVPGLRPCELIAVAFLRALERLNQP